MEDFPPLPYPQMPGNDYTAEDMRNYVLADRRQRTALLAERDALRGRLEAAANYIDTLGGDSKGLRSALAQEQGEQRDRQE